MRSINKAIGFMHIPPGGAEEEGGGDTDPLQMYSSQRTLVWGGGTGSCLLSY
jgi:hypothetical protein